MGNSRSLVIVYEYKQLYFSCLISTQERFYEFFYAKCALLLFVKIIFWITFVLLKCLKFFCLKYLFWSPCSWNRMFESIWSQGRAKHNVFYDFVFLIICIKYLYIIIFLCYWRDFTYFVYHTRLTCFERKGIIEKVERSKQEISF